VQKQKEFPMARRASAATLSPAVDVIDNLPVLIRSLLKAAKYHINAHNTALQTIAPKDVIDVNHFVTDLMKAGYTTVDALRRAKWEDLEKLGLPRGLARMVAQEFRTNGKKDEKMGEGSEKILSGKSYKQMTLRQALALYNVADENTPTALLERLLADCGQYRCIVADPNGTVQIEATLDRLRLMKNSFELPDYHMGDDGHMHDVYKVGESKRRTFGENPLFPGQPLNGSKCPITGFDWTPVDMMTRIVIYLAIKETNEADSSTPMKAQQILDILINKGQPHKYFPLAYREYQRLQEIKQLPSLLLTPGQAGGPKKQDPFFRS
jgi:hypothetical protein